jgi:hypothetical protein
MQKQIKLLEVNKLEDGTMRLQSQLMVGRDSVDFIMKDGVLKNYSNGEKGFGFYEYKHPYLIVDSLKDMNTQQL